MCLSSLVLSISEVFGQFIHLIFTCSFQGWAHTRCSINGVEGLSRGMEGESGNSFANVLNQTLESVKEVS